MMNKYSEEIWNDNYRGPEETTIEDTWKRLANEGAKIENKEIRKNISEEFYSILDDFKFIPGGRIMANLGLDTRHATTLMNCFVHHPKDINYKDPDSIEGIYTMLQAQAHTLKSEGGYGTNFSWIRPAGTYVKGIGSRTPGVLKFMELWDKSSEIITMGSEKILGALRDDEKTKIRKGAQMAVLSIWHPEVEDYIVAKQTSGRLTKFNMSIGITKGFMKAVEEDKPWNLIFPDTEHPKYESEWNGDIEEWRDKGYTIITHKTVKAKDLWNAISYATYTRNEPGVIFLDLFNKINPLAYTEDIFATNPCVTGETLVAVADGRNAVTIKQLAEEASPVNIYSIDRGKTTIKKATKIFKTGIKPVLKIVLDDNSYLKVTEDHKIMLRNGKYKLAKDIKPNDSLMPFNSYISNKRYRQISSNIGRDKRQYRMIAEHNNLIVDPKNTAIHHIDFNSLNDKIENLKALPHSEHRKIHDISGNNNPMIKWYPSASEEERKRYHNNMSDAVSGEKNGRFSGIDNMTLLNYGIALTKNLNRQFTESEWQTYAKEYNIPQSFSNYRKTKFGSLHKFAKRCAHESNLPMMEKYELRSYIQTQNHKVRSVHSCGIEEVYDMIVPGTNNFGVITSYKDNNYVESSGIFVHNCGEIGMATGVCNLGSLNLTKFVKVFKDKLIFDYDEYARCIKIAVRYLDNINDISRAPLKEYKDSMTDKRRIGLGNMGLGSLMLMFGIRYGSEESLELVKNIYKLKAETELLASAELGKEKGSFKLFDHKKYFNTYWWNNLKISPSVKKKIENVRHMRNSHHSMNAPNGNTSIYAGIVTGGIEPAFMLEYTRWAIVTEYERRNLRKKGFTWPDPMKGEWFETDHMKFSIKGDEQILKGSFNGTDYEVDKNRGLVKATLVSDYGWEFAKELYKDKLKKMQNDGLFASAMELSVSDHIDVLKVVAHYTNMNNSKTVNLPSEYSYEDFKSLYFNAWKSNIKGMTTYRTGTMTAVLETQKVKIYQNELERQFAEAGDKVIEHVVKIPNEYFARGFKIKDNGRKKWYINLAFVDSAMTQPYAIFVSTNNVESNEVTEELIKSMEKLLREKGLSKKLVEEQISKYENQKNTTRIARIIGMALRHNLKIQDVVRVLDKYPHELSSFVFHLSKLLSKYIQDGTKVRKEKCPSCKYSAIVYQDGCKTCTNCGWSKC